MSQRILILFLDIQKKRMYRSSSSCNSSIINSSGFIVSKHNLKNVRCTDDTVLMADAERKLQEILDEAVKENENSMNC